MNTKPFVAWAGLLTLSPTLSHAQTVVFSDNFDDNTVTGWTFLDRNGAVEIANANWVETNQRLEQQTDNYDFPRDLEDDPFLGTIALAPEQIGGHYEITTTLISLEPDNIFQDEDIVFGYVDENNFYMLETIPGSINLFQVLDGDRILITSGTFTFSHDPVVVTLRHDAVTGKVTAVYGGVQALEFTDPIFIISGDFSVGVGSNNDAFAIDDFSITALPPSPPPALEITSLIRNVEFGDIEITWNSEIGKEYFLDSSTDLMNWTEVEDITATETTTSIFDSSTFALPRVFYRIRVEE